MCYERDNEIVFVGLSKKMRIFNAFMRTNISAFVGIESPVKHNEDNV